MPSQRFTHETPTGTKIQVDVISPIGLAIGELLPYTLTLQVGDALVVLSSDKQIHGYSQIRTANPSPPAPPAPDS